MEQDPMGREKEEKQGPGEEICRHDSQRCLKGKEKPREGSVGDMTEAETMLALEGERRRNNVTEEMNDRLQNTLESCKYVR